MGAKKLENVSWYRDQEALDRGEPGICHSYIASLATVLRTIGDDVDPVWLMGTSGFAFRLYIAQNMCPSCMSVFAWEKILPETLKQVGFNAKYISRMWDEEKQEEERRLQAQASVLDGIDRGIPAIVWDLIIPEWGLIIGYNDQNHEYNVLWEDKHGTLPFEKLGRNGIDILSVTILEESNNRSRQECIHKSLQIAVAHAEQKEWMERPDYQDGLPAYDIWAQLMEFGAHLTRTGRIQNIDPEMPNHILYHAAHHYSARCYAREYMHTITDGNRNLQKAAACYAQVADFLRPICDAFKSKRLPDEQTFLNVAAAIRKAKETEEQGLEFIRQYLAE